ncbi:MAG: FAD-dependent thymidylate synthase [Patescibacteria group bacterium]|nr:FAD-dependent thymidylate synthase [Patescibacteria group bacterium]MCL5261791.1 FAD-dependent thymidylate synthase [Patescibacteria group bacterium]
MPDFSIHLRWPGADESLKKAALGIARRFVSRPVGYSFTKTEQLALAPFFTNSDRGIYLAHTLPAALLARLVARYSRMNNPRGLRGVFVDAALPELLASRIVGSKANPAAWLKAKEIKSLDQLRQDAEGEAAFRNFLENFRCDPDYLRDFASSETVNRFFGDWVERFGHGSIGRVANISICAEGVSLMAAKALEEARAGAGYMELSTRYVNMAGTDVYPIADIVRLSSSTLAGRVKEMIDLVFGLYRNQSDPDRGALPLFLTERYGHLFEDKRQLKATVGGEVCDVLGNLLPGAALTSLGIAVDGEAFGSLLKHLLLHGTPETIAVAEAVLSESEKTGSNQLARHYEPSDKEQELWGFLDPMAFEDMRNNRPVVPASSFAPIQPAFDLLRLKPQFKDLSDEEISDRISRDRKATDKLPDEFESVSVGLRFVMSRRGERDLQRHVLAAHGRTAISPWLGFYRYDKPRPAEIDSDFRHVYGLSYSLNEALSGEPVWLRELVLPLGNLVGCTIVMNLREAEFIGHQRTKQGVNHEVRQIVLKINEELAKAYPLWTKLSRSDPTPGYAFSRGDPIPLETK